MNETWNGKVQKITHTMKVEMEKEIPSQACEERIHSQILEMYEQRKHENLKMERESGMKDRAENRRWNRWNLPKMAAATALCFILGGGAVFAGGKITGIIMGSRAGGDYWEYQDLGKAEEKAGMQFYTPESFSNGYTMKSISITDIVDYTEDGEKRNPGKEMSFVYQQDGENSDAEEVNLSVSKVRDSYGDPAENSMETREADGVSLFYKENECMFVPADYVPTEEEKERDQNDPGFSISYGADEDEKETLIYRGVTFRKEGLQYVLYAMNTDLSSEEMMDMAAEIVSPQQ